LARAYKLVKVNFELRQKQIFAVPTCCIWGIGLCNNDEYIKDVFANLGHQLDGVRFKSPDVLPENVRGVLNDPQRKLALINSK